MEKQVSLVQGPALQPRSSRENACAAITPVMYLIVCEKASCKTIKYSSIIYSVIVVVKNNNFYCSVLLVWL